MKEEWECQGVYSWGSLTCRHWTDIRNETLFYNKVPYVKRTIGTPAKMYKAIARLWVDEAVLHEEG